LKEIIASAKAPAAIGPYSQAVKANGFIFVSGQIPLDPATGAFKGGDIKATTRQVLENLKGLLEDAGSSLDKVVKTTVFLKDIGDFGAMNEVYAEYFGKAAPARSAVQVAALPKDMPLEIEVIALA